MRRIDSPMAAATRPSDAKRTARDALGNGLERTTSGALASKLQTTRRRDRSARASHRPSGESASASGVARGSGGVTSPPWGLPSELKGVTRPKESTATNATAVSAVAPDARASPKQRKGIKRG